MRGHWVLLHPQRVSTRTVGDSFCFGARVHHPALRASVLLHWLCDALWRAVLLVFAGPVNPGSKTGTTPSHPPDSCKQSVRRLVLSCVHPHPRSTARDHSGDSPVSPPTFSARPPLAGCVAPDIHGAHLHPGARPALPATPRGPSPSPPRGRCRARLAQPHNAWGLSSTFQENRVG